MRTLKKRTVSRMLRASSDLGPPGCGTRTGSRDPQDVPRGAQSPEPHLGQLGANFGLSWATSGAILGQFWLTKRQKTLSEITRQKVCRDHCSPDAQKSLGSVDGFGAPAPLEIRHLSICPPFPFPLFSSHLSSSRFTILPL